MCSKIKLPKKHWYLPSFFKGPEYDFPKISPFWSISTTHCVARIKKNLAPTEQNQNPLLYF